MDLILEMGLILERSYIRTYTVIEISLANSVHLFECENPRVVGSAAPSTLASFAPFVCTHIFYCFYAYFCMFQLENNLKFLNKIYQFYFTNFHYT